MDDGRLLLDAILAAPEEDTPRLAFADWLDEQGGEANCAWATMIRADTAVPRTPVPESLFLRALPASWGIDFDPGDHEGAVIHWHRGFIDSVAMPTPEFLRHAKDIFARHPVAQVTLCDFRLHTPLASRPERVVRVSAEESLIAGHDWEGSDSFLPMSFKEFLTGGTASNNYGDRRYPTAEDALAALSRACVAWGMRAAGR